VAPVEIPKAPAQFTTPDQLSTSAANASLNASAQGRDALRNDLGDNTPKQTIAPENDVVRDMPAEEAATVAAAQAAATAAAQAVKDRKKRRFRAGKKRSLFIGGISGGAGITSDVANLKKNY